MKEELLEKLMVIRSQIAMHGRYLYLLEDCEAKLLDKTITASNLDELTEEFKLRASFKAYVDEFEITQKELASFLDLKYWELQRVRNIYALIEKGKAKTLEEAIALTE